MSESNHDKSILGVACSPINILHATGSFRVYQTSRWHQNKGCVLVHGPPTKTELFIWCQQEVLHNLNGHPLHVANMSNMHGWHLSQKLMCVSGARSTLMMTLFRRKWWVRVSCLTWWAGSASKTSSRSSVSRGLYRKASLPSLLRMMRRIRHFVNRSG